MRNMALKNQDNNKNNKDDNGSSKVDMYGDAAGMLMVNVDNSLLNQKLSSRNIIVDHLKSMYQKMKS